VSTDAEHRIVEVNGTSFFVRDTGSGPPVVLLHGFGLDSRMWDPQVAVLRANFRAIAYDDRGFGRSGPAGSEPYAQEDDLHALLAALGVARAHFVGLSMGGRTALRFALRHPEAVSSLVLVSSAADGQTWSDTWVSEWRRMTAEARAGHVDEARRLWYEHPLFATTRRVDRAREVLAEMTGAYSGWHWVNRDPLVIPKPPALERLGDISAPALVVSGERDLPDFHLVADRLVRGLRGAQRMRVLDAGHLLNLERAELTNGVIAAFLTSGEVARRARVE
jgi:pimeloyl-ACP methyl ester carboxylesterase